MKDRSDGSALMDWFGKMVACVETLPPDERAALEQWDQQRPEGVATSDWPGFDKYLPPKPWESKRTKRATGLKNRGEIVNESFDAFADEDEFKDDSDTKAMLKAIDAVVEKRTPQEAYNWLNDLENKIMDRTEELASNPEVEG